MGEIEPCMYGEMAGIAIGVMATMWNDLPAKISKGDSCAVACVQAKSFSWHHGEIICNNIYGKQNIDVMTYQYGYEIYYRKAKREAWRAAAENHGENEAEAVAINNGAAYGENGMAKNGNENKRLNENNRRKRNENREIAASGWNNENNEESNVNGGVIIIWQWRKWL